MQCLHIFAPRPRPSRPSRPSRPPDVSLLPVVLVRNSPGARAAFVGYLVLLHLWAFVILGLRSHSSSIAIPPTLGGGNNGTA